MNKDNGKGLEVRYFIFKADGSSLPASAKCFVLRYDNDEVSRKALGVYAAETPHAQLAKDLHRILDALEDEEVNEQGEQTPDEAMRSL